MNGSLHLSSKPTHWRPLIASPVSGLGGDSSGSASLASDLAMATLFVFPQTNGAWMLPTVPEELPQTSGSALPNMAYAVGAAGAAAAGDPASGTTVTAASAATA